ncbi:MAG: hypothetical protein AABZ21_03220, partial [Deltaproteobacteria bacterium]
AMNKGRVITIWVLLALLVNGIAVFAYNIAVAEDTTKFWALLATTYIYYLGLTQTGIVFSAIMRIAKSEWGRHFSMLGEALTLSFIPAAFGLFLIIYFGGTEHLFYWARHSSSHGALGEAHVRHISPWLGTGLFFWRTIVSMSLFYIMSWVYFRWCRLEERCDCDMERRLNLTAGFVMFFYVVTNTNTAWDFGMMIIQHWESTIFPAYYWVGNIFAGTAFVFLMAVYFIPRAPGEEMDKDHLDSMGKLLIGFSILWIYMFWSQHIVIWYSDLPNLTGPLLKQREGSFAPVFTLMIITVFIIPFFALLFRRVKLRVLSLSAVAFIICIGIWINRYLMVMPVFTNGEESVFATYTGVALFFAGLATVLLSFIAFRAFSPDVNLVPASAPKEHH